MKKIFMFAAMASVALASCTKNEPAVTPEQGEAILFNSPVVAPATKAASELTSNFFVFAYYSENDSYNGTESLYLRDREFKKTGGYWAADPAAYWPKNGNLTFCAYAPEYTGLTVDQTNSAAALVLNYTVDVDEQKDVLYSDWLLNKVVDDQGTVNPNGYNTTGIDLPFHHALSKVQFSVKAGSDAAAAKMTVKSITLRGVKPSGKLTVPYNNDGDDAAWATSGDAVTYTVIENNTAALTVDGAAIGAPFMLIPQSLSTVDNLVVTYELATDGDPIEQVAKISLTDTWACGTSYTYTLVFNLDEIKLAPVVAEDWATGSAVVPEI